MRSMLALVLFASFASAQTPETDAAVKAKLATLKFLGSLYDSESGGYRNEPTAKPSLRATNAAVKATKYLGGKLDDQEKTAKFVLGCYDDKTGAFAEPGGEPDVTTSCIGVMAAMELGIDKEKIAKSKTFLEMTVKPDVFEEIRIAAAAVEAFGGVKEWTPKVTLEWFTTALGYGLFSVQNGDAQQNTRDRASSDVAMIRLSEQNVIKADVATKGYCTGQREDGGWGKAGEKSSDMESCYRVMRAFYMLKEKPKDSAKLRGFIAKHRNDDGGYATKPGEKSSATGTYYAVIITKWLDELEKK